MIRQSDLQVVAACKRRLSELEQRPEVQEYLSEKGRLQRLLEVLRARLKAGEECASGG
jgi:hypothetical protein